MSSRVILERVLIGLAILLLVPSYLAALSLHAFIVANDSEGLVAIFWITQYSIVLWLPLLIYWLVYKTNMSVLVRRATIAPVLVLAGIAIAAGVLW